MKKLLIFKIFLVLATKLYAQAPAEFPQEMLEIIRPGYSLNYPSRWALDSSHAFGSDIFIISAREDSSDKFSENFNVIAQDLPEDTFTLKFVSNENLRQIKNLATDLEILKEEFKSVNGSDCFWMVYQHTQGIFQLRTEQYYFIKRGRLYVITYSAERNKEIKFQQLANSVLESFRLL